MTDRDAPTPEQIDRAADAILDSHGWGGLAGVLPVEYAEAALSAVVPPLHARIRELEGLLRDAVDELEDVLAYVPEWAVEKWRYRDSLARLVDLRPADDEEAQ